MKPKNTQLGFYSTEEDECGMNAREFVSSLPSRVAPEAIEGMETVFQFDISGEQGIQATVALKDGKVDYQEGLHGQAKCVVSATDENLKKVLKGELNPMMAVMTGKIKISNTGEMMKYAKIFGIM